MTTIKLRSKTTQTGRVQSHEREYRSASHYVQSLFAQRCSIDGDNASVTTLAFLHAEFHYDELTSKATLNHLRAIEDIRASANGNLLATDTQSHRRFDLFRVLRPLLTGISSGCQGVMQRLIMTETLAAKNKIWLSIHTVLRLKQHGFETAQPA